MRFAWVAAMVACGAASLPACTSAARFDVDVVDVPPALDVIAETAALDIQGDDATASPTDGTDVATTGDARDADDAAVTDVIDSAVVDVSDAAMSCADPDAGCTVGGDCCRGLCSVAGRCACSPAGMLCHGNDDCCTGLCASSLCTCMPILAPCASNAECCSGACNPTGSCLCGYAGTRCNDDPDCCGTLVCVRGQCGV